MLLTKPIIALDYSTKEEVKQFLNQFQNEQLNVKVGMELYYQTGSALLSEITEAGHHVFLDLKLHDIPNTVYKAMKGLAALGVSMVNVHAAGGKQMMQAALQGLEEGSKHQRPTLIAVTQLTSTSEQQMKAEQLINCSMKESVIHYSKLAYESGLDGVVCSSLEASSIAEHTSQSFYRVCPGIRLSGDKVHDQVRVVTPEKAKRIGATHIVVGRSITGSNHSLYAYQQVLKEWEEA